MAPFSNMQKKCRDHMYGVPKAKGFDDVTFPSPQPGVPSRRAINVRWTRDVGLQLHMPPAKRRAVPNNATAPAARSMPACHRMGYSSWRTAVPCPMHLAGRHGTGVGSSGGGGIDCRAATRLTHRSTLSRVCAGAIWTKIERRYDRRKLPQLAAATARPSCLARSLARPPAPQSAARSLVAGSPVARSIVDR